MKQVYRNIKLGLGAVYNENFGFWSEKMTRVCNEPVEKPEEKRSIETMLIKTDEIHCWMCWSIYLKFNNINKE